MQINNAVVAQAEADAPKSGFETSHFYTVTDNEDGTIALRTASDEEIDASGLSTVDQNIENPRRKGYTGYLLNYGDGTAPNGAPYGFGIQFPRENQKGDYFLRTDFLPNRLFRYDGTRWVKVEDDLRMTLSNTLDRFTQKTSFINNTNTNTINGEIVEERQSLSKALKPKADN